MAGAQLPDALKRRDMLAQADPGLAQAGKDFLEAGRLGEALECLAAAGDDQGLEQAAQKAVEMGDLFIYRGACRLMGREMDPTRLAQIEQNAQASGKLAYAAQAASAMAAEQGG